MASQKFPDVLSVLCCGVAATAANYQYVHRDEYRDTCTWGPGRVNQIISGRQGSCNNGRSVIVSSPRQRPGLLTRLKGTGHLSKKDWHGVLLSLKRHQWQLYEHCPILRRVQGTKTGSAAALMDGCEDPVEEIYWWPMASTASRACVWSSYRMNTRRLCQIWSLSWTVTPDTS